MRLIGLDVSLNCTGYAVIDVDDLTSKNMVVVDYGYIPNDKDETTEQRLAVVYHTVKSIADKYNPDIWVGESQFFSNNVKTLMQLSHTHGICMLLASTYGKRIYYYSPMTIKSTVLGGAKAKDEDGKKKTTKQWKKEIENKIIEVFGRQSLKKDYTDDVTDALAVCVTYVYKEGAGFLESDKAKKKPATKKKTKK